jgi:hypothetical protein
VLKQEWLYLKRIGRGHAWRIPSRWRGDGRLLPSVSKCCCY